MGKVSIHVTLTFLNAEKFPVENEFEKELTQSWHASLAALNINCHSTNEMRNFERTIENSRKESYIPTNTCFKRSLIKGKGDEFYTSIKWFWNYASLI